MRGIRSAIDEIIVFVRIIPAHAGNTQASIRSVLPVSFCFLKDHPRSCGEYYSQQLYKVFYLGSSPLMRGILKLFVLFVFIIRIIPAHAGNTKALCAFRIHYKDHPRSCGEYLFLARLLVVNLGSSPLMRGILSDFF